VIQPDNPFKIAFLLSGSGSTMENLLNHIISGKVKAKISVVISSCENAYGIKRAENWDIPYKIVPFKTYKSDLIAYSNKISAIIDSYNINLIVFGGFMSQYIIPQHYINKAINIHPALIPAFCGKGFYGDKVHQAVLDYGVKITGCTVHFVDQNYDTGPIITQESVIINDSDTLDSIKEKVQNLERSLYPRVIQAIVENRVIVNGRHVKILKEI